MPKRTVSSAHTSLFRMRITRTTCAVRTPRVVFPTQRRLVPSRPYRTWAAPHGAQTTALVGRLIHRIGKVHILRQLSKSGIFGTIRRYDKAHIQGECRTIKSSHV